MIHIASVQTTAVGNVGGGEDNLMSYTLPVGKLDLDTKGVRVTAWGSFVNNANAKTLKLYFGSTAILSNGLTTNVGDNWKIEASVHRTGADAQDYVAQITTVTTALAASTVTSQGSLTEDDGATITIKCTGEATSDNDIVQEGMIVEFITP